MMVHNARKAKLYEIRDPYRNQIIPDYCIPKKLERMFLKHFAAEIGFERHCVVCDDPMRAHRSTRKYCTPACRQRAYRVRHALVTYPGGPGPFRKPRWSTNAS